MGEDLRASKLKRAEGENVFGLESGCAVTADKQGGDNDREMINETRVEEVGVKRGNGVDEELVDVIALVKLLESMIEVDFGGVRDDSIRFLLGVYVWFDSAPLRSTLRSLRHQTPTPAQLNSGMITQTNKIKMG